MIFRPTHGSTPQVFYIQGSQSPFHGTVEWFLAPVVREVRRDLGGDLGAASRNLCRLRELFGYAEIATLKWINMLLFAMGLCWLTPPPVDTGKEPAFSGLRLFRGLTY
jgi:hypothetical protein